MTEPNKETNVVPQGTPAGGEKDQDTYFLKVDDRTRYKTQEEAVTGFKEAGERIGSLAPYEKLAKEYGITDPEELTDLLDELAELRAAKEAAGEPAEKKGTGDVGRKATPPAAAGEPEGLSDEDKAALKWADRVGLATKGTLEERLNQIQSAIDELRSSRETDAKAQQAERIEEGRAYIPRLLKANELPDDDKKLTLRVERHIRAYLEDESFDKKGNLIPRSPLDRFYRGGAGMQSAVDEAFQDFLDTHSLGKAKSAAGYAAQKGTAQKGTPKPLPAGTAPGVSGEPPEGPKTFKEAHEKAWEMYQQRVKG